MRLRRGPQRPVRPRLSVETRNGGQEPPGIGVLGRVDDLLNCAPLDDGSRLIVAPEALSRFYLGEVSQRPASERRVGASWMTREDRPATKPPLLTPEEWRSLKSICDSGDKI